MDWRIRISMRLYKKKFARLLLGSLKKKKLPIIVYEFVIYMENIPIICSWKVFWWRNELELFYMKGAPSLLSYPRHRDLRAGQKSDDPKLRFGSFLLLFFYFAEMKERGRTLYGNARYIVKQVKQNSGRLGYD